MAPKNKAQKMNLSDFLNDSTLGSWADEMDSLPSAPAARADEEPRRRDFGERGGGFHEYGARESRYPPREELPLPTAPPFTAFIGNLAFDLTESDIEEFFRVSLKSIKIIKDREEKSKGFGYVEFQSLQDLKDGLGKSGGQMAGRVVRVSVAEPQKERERGDGRGGDDDKFSNPWRRDGPLPDRGDRGFSSRGPPSRYGDESQDRGERMGFGSKFVPSGDAPQRGFRGGPEREAPSPSEAETTSDWRASRRGPLPPVERPGPPSRKTSGFSQQEGGPAHAADSEDNWTKGSKFSPSVPETTPPGTGSRKSSFFRGDGPRAEEEPNDWRTAPRRGPLPASNGRHGSYDRNADSVPSTPNMGRRKLELLPRTGQSTATSPVGSPKAATPTTGPRANPFGGARPVDAAAREKEIEDRLAKERETRFKDRSNEPPARPAPSHDRGEGAWRDRRTGPSTGSSRPVSAVHSRTTSREGVPTPPSPPQKKSQPFSFAALASEIEVVEGEEDDQENQRGAPEVAV